jgi:hypothetical protein
MDHFRSKSLDPRLLEPQRPIVVVAAGADHIALNNHLLMAAGIDRGKRLPILFDTVADTEEEEEENQLHKQVAVVVNLQVAEEVEAMD